MCNESFELLSLKLSFDTVVYFPDPSERGAYKRGGLIESRAYFNSQNAKPILIGCIYRPGDQSLDTFATEMDEVISNYGLERWELILLGDYDREAASVRDFTAVSWSVIEGVDSVNNAAFLWEKCLKKLRINMRR